MDEETFRALAAKEWAAIPARFARLVENVALLVEDEPDEHVREEENLTEGDTLLGLYRGVPRTERGSEYGVGGTLPDTITLYRLPILEAVGSEDPELVAREIRDTIWHEVGHYFGFGEESVQRREDDGTNRFH
jgi:predicted Zn-dependent protease with MMP-like domain